MDTQREIKRFKHRASGGALGNGCLKFFYVIGACCMAGAVRLALASDHDWGGTVQVFCFAIVFMAAGALLQVGIQRMMARLYGLPVRVSMLLATLLDPNNQVFNEAAETTVGSYLQLREGLARCRHLAPAKSDEARRLAAACATAYVEATVQRNGHTASVNPTALAYVGRLQQAATRMASLAKAGSAAEAEVKLNDVLRLLSPTAAYGA